MKQIKQLLQFDSIDQVPRDFSCKFCGDFCCSPKQIVGNSNYFNCDCTTFNQFFPRSSFFYQFINFKCKFCFKKIFAQKYFEHNLECQIIYFNSFDFMNNFQIVSQINENDSMDYQQLQIDEWPQDQQQNQNLSIQLINYRDKRFQDFKCKKCQQTVNREQCFYHYKKCIFNFKYQDFKISDEMMKSIQFFKEFQKFCHMFQLNPQQFHQFIINRKKLIDSSIEQHYQEKKRKNHIKNLNKMLDYLKEK